MSREEAQELYQQGIQFSQDGRLSEAIEKHSAATAADPEWALPFLNLGVVHLQRGDPVSAIPALEHGLGLASSDEEKAVFLSNLGQAYYGSGNLEAAIKAYQKSLGHQEAPTTLVELGVAWHDLGQNDKAISCLKRYLANPVEELYSTLQVRQLVDSYEGKAPRRGCAALFLAVVLVLAICVCLLL